MFVPNEFVGNFWFGYIIRHTKTDYLQGSPLIERLNPLRYEIGIGRDRPCVIVLNRKAWMQREWSNFNYWLWKRRYLKMIKYIKSCF